MKTARIFIYVLIILLSAIATNAQCVPASTAAGALDTCFDGDGKVTTDITEGFDFADAVVVQPDGKIVAAGTAGASSTSLAGDFAVVRYNVNGSLDTTFDGDGIVITDIGAAANDGDRIKGVALQSDGKIIVAGTTWISTDTGFALARYNADGSLDTTFDGDGKVIFRINTFLMDAFDMALQTDGKIIVAGKFFSADMFHSIVARFNSNGSLDTSFDNTGGWRSTELTGINGVALQPDGKILLAGGLNNGDLGVVRLNPNGSTDLFFGNNGVAVYGANSNDYAWTVGVRFDGGIFAGGTSSLSQPGGNNGGLVRFRTDGTIGASMVHIDDNVFWDLTFQSDGKILTAGRSFIHAASGFTIRRFIDANILDTSFNGGVVRVKFLPDATPESVHVSGIETTRDNKIVAVGQTAEHTDPPSPGSFAVARLFSGLLAPHAERFDFDGDGKADVSVYRPSERRWYVFRSSDSGVTERFYGSNGDAPVPADYDGDGKTDFAVFNAGDWKYLSSASGTESATHWGTSGDITRVSDFNGDGRADFIVFRPLQNIWYRLSGTGEFNDAVFGLSGDKPLAGDFDGDGKSDKAIYRPSTGDWWWQSSVDNGTRATHWGIPTDVPAPADYDGDGKTDFAVYRPSTGVWYIVNSGDLSVTILSFGLAEDKPVPADYDGDGKVDVAVFRPSTGTWYLLRSTAGFAALQFGLSTDVPLPNAYIQ